MAQRMVVTLISHPVTQQLGDRSDDAFAVACARVKGLFMGYQALGGDRVSVEKGCQVRSGSSYLGRQCLGWGFGRCLRHRSVEHGVGRSRRLGRLGSIRVCHRLWVLGTSRAKPTMPWPRPAGDRSPRSGPASRADQPGRAANPAGRPAVPKQGSRQRRPVPAGLWATSWWAGSAAGQ